MMSPTDTLSPGGERTSLVILLPVFNDWEAVALLLPSIDRELQKAELTARVILIDDASTVDLPENLCRARLAAIARIEVLSLRRNLGHQRALAVGLSYVEAHADCAAVVVMDADGEDAPGDIPRLYQKFEETGGQKIIFAERAQRAEDWTFRLFYQIYRIVHLVLTGVKVRAGNFSIVPRPLLERLVVSTELWSHYVAAVHRVRLPFAMLPTKRARRLAGDSKMNFVSLAIHGLRAMSVFGDQIGVRLLVTIVALFGLSVGSAGLAVAAHLGADSPVPSWIAPTTGLVLVLLLQALVTALAFVFLTLQGSSRTGVLPLRDYHYFLGECRLIYAAQEQMQLQP